MRPLSLDPGALLSLAILDELIDLSWQAYAECSDLDRLEVFAVKLKPEKERSYWEVELPFETKRIGPRQFENGYEAIDARAGRYRERSIFQPLQGDSRSSKQAKAICRECRAANACLRYAIITNQEHGIWGGYGQDQRRNLRRFYDKHGYSERFTREVDRVIAKMRAKEPTTMVDDRNSENATCGYISTKNRGCKSRADDGSPCKRCRWAGHEASMKRRAKDIDRDYQMLDQDERANILASFGLDSIEVAAA